MVLGSWESMSSSTAGEEHKYQNSKVSIKHGKPNFFFTDDNKYFTYMTTCNVRITASKDRCLRGTYVK